MSGTKGRPRSSTFAKSTLFIFRSRQQKTAGSLVATKPGQTGSGFAGHEGRSGQVRSGQEQARVPGPIIHSEKHAEMGTSKLYVLAPRLRRCEWSGALGGCSSEGRAGSRNHHTQGCSKLKKNRKNLKILSFFRFPPFTVHVYLQFSSHVYINSSQREARWEPSRNWPGEALFHLISHACWFP